MKRFVVNTLVVSFLLAGLKVVPCFGMAMECCQAASQVSLSSTYQPCCDEGTSLKLASLAVSKKESQSFEGFVIATIGSVSPRENHLILRCEDPEKKKRPPKDSLYLQYSALRL